MLLVDVLFLDLREELSQCFVGCSKELKRDVPRTLAAHPYFSPHSNGFVGCSLLAVLVCSVGVALSCVLHTQTSQPLVDSNMFMCI